MIILRQRTILKKILVFHLFDEFFNSMILDLFQISHLCWKFPKTEDYRKDSVFLHLIYEY